MYHEAEDTLDRKQVDLAKQYNVTPQTIRKWQNRDEFTDKSHRPHRPLCQHCCGTHNFVDKHRVAPHHQR
ncbi:phage terminase small subunit-related protein [Thiolapillus sp.]|uniref:phage terminase small subunit-related protein n=1 Tax=Thiolapillus sp. TaxID=2017437 RepID=UPI0035ABF94F